MSAMHKRASIGRMRRRRASASTSTTTRTSTKTSAPIKTKMSSPSSLIRFSSLQRRNLGDLRPRNLQRNRLWREFKKTTPRRREFSYIACIRTAPVSLVVEALASRNQANSRLGYQVGTELLPHCSSARRALQASPSKSPCTTANHPSCKERIQM